MFACVSSRTLAVGKVLPTPRRCLPYPNPAASSPSPRTPPGSNAAMAFLPAAPMGLRARSAAPVRAGRAPLGLRMQQATVDREQDVGIGQADMRKDAESLMQPCPETKCVRVCIRVRVPLLQRAACRRPHAACRSR